MEAGVPMRREMLALFDSDPVVPPEFRCDENGAFLPPSSRG